MRVTRPTHALGTLAAALLVAAPIAPLSAQATPEKVAAALELRELGPAFMGGASRTSR